jgi:hypothetical protein
VKIKHRLFFVVACLAVSVVNAKFSITEMFTVEKFDGAKQAAESKNKPILFLYSEKDSKNTELTAVSQDIINAFKPSTVMVYVDATSNDMKGLPHNVRKAIGEAGNIYPIAVIFDSKVKEVLFSLAYETNDLRRRKLLSEGKKKIGG